MDRHRAVTHMLLLNITLDTRAVIAPLLSHTISGCTYVCTYHDPRDRTPFPHIRPIESRRIAGDMNEYSPASPERTASVWRSAIDCACPKAHSQRELSREARLRGTLSCNYFFLDFYFMASSTATATATVAPTMGLLPMPRKPIISTCAGTEEEPANWASECMRPMVSVMP